MELPPPRTWQRPADMPAPFATGAAVTPPPLEIDPEKRSGNPGWLIGVMLISLAAVLGVVLLTGGNDDDSKPTATSAQVASSSAITTAATSGVDSTAAEAVPTSTEPPVTAAETTVPAETTLPPTTTLTPETTAPPTSIGTSSTGQLPADVTVVVAAADGTHLINSGGDSLILNRPNAASWRAFDGSVISQDASGRTDDSERTHIRRFAPGGEAVIVAASTGTYLRLHDVSAGSAGNQIQVLYSLQEGTSPEDTDEGLYLLDLFSGSTRFLGTIGAWESGTGQLDLANDIIVGESASGASTGAFAVDLSGNPIDLTGPIGHEATYGDCAECPHNYSVDPTGTRLYWTELGSLVSSDRDGGNPSSIDIAGLVGGFGVELDAKDGVVIINRDGLAALIVDTRSTPIAVTELAVVGHAAFA